MKKLFTIIIAFALCTASLYAQKDIGGGEVILPPKVSAGCTLDKSTLNFTATVGSITDSQMLTIDVYSTALPDKLGKTPVVGGISLSNSSEFEFKIVSVLGSPMVSNYK